MILTSASIEGIVKFVQFIKVEKLSLINCSITDSGIKSITNTGLGVKNSLLAKCKYLKDLDLTGNAIGDEGVGAIISALKFNEVSICNLSFNKIFSICKILDNIFSKTLNIYLEGNPLVQGEIDLIEEGTNPGILLGDISDIN